MVTRVALLLMLMVCAATWAVGQNDRGKRLVLDIEGKGKITIRLFQSQAPRTVARIESLVTTRFYDGQRFHKVAKSPRPFLVQIGAPGSRTKSIDDDSLNTEGTGTRIPFEDSGLKNDAAGMVGLSTIKGDRDSGDCQFYILLGPASFLDGSYTVFGRVVDGMDILKRIEKGDRLVSATILSG